MITVKVRAAIGSTSGTPVTVLSDKELSDYYKDIDTICQAVEAMNSLGENFCMMNGMVKDYFRCALSGIMCVLWQRVEKNELTTDGYMERLNQVAEALRIMNNYHE